MLSESFKQTHAKPRANLSTLMRRSICSDALNNSLKLRGELMWKSLSAYVIYEYANIIDNNMLKQEF